ncbi:unnamed protein product [Schistosoma curassoni]|uniref:YpzI family protein n=1 Tax=Schistosoma curassoni TaxID=6186 RepID=A0A183L865_9TREM|nr:unnamed protein product [Schistosoma curassoni]
MSLHQRPKKSGWPSDKSRAGKQQDLTIYHLKHRSNCKHASPSIQDLGGATSADELERKTPHQDTKEKKSE